MALPTKSIWLSTQRCNSDCRSGFELECCGVALSRAMSVEALALRASAFVLFSACAKSKEGF